MSEGARKIADGWECSDQLEEVIDATVAPLVSTAESALQYMRLHKYADQAWADALEKALEQWRTGR